MIEPDPVDQDGRAVAPAASGIGRTDRDRIGVSIGIERREIRLSRCVDLRGRNGAGAQILRDHQRGGVERCLHRRARMNGAAIIDRCPHEGDEGYAADRKDHCDIASLGATEFSEQPCKCEQGNLSHVGTNAVRTRSTSAIRH